MNTINFVIGGLIINNDEIIKLILQAKEKDKGAMEEIIKRYTPFVIKTARSIYVKGQEVGDLVAIGQAAIIKAVNMYDTTRENAFTTYVFNGFTLKTEV